MRAEDVEQWYGPWAALTPADAATFLAGFDRPWWVAGGHAIEAFTGVGRAHDDLDLVVFRRDLPRLRAVLGDRWHLWSVGAGMLRPLDDESPSRTRTPNRSGCASTRGRRGSRTYC